MKTYEFLFLVETGKISINCLLCQFQNLFLTKTNKSIKREENKKCDFFMNISIICQSTLLPCQYIACDLSIDFNFFYQSHDTCHVVWFISGQSWIVSLNKCDLTGGKSLSKYRVNFRLLCQYLLMQYICTEIVYLMETMKVQLIFIDMTRFIITWKDFYCNCISDI